MMKFTNNVSIHEGQTTTEGADVNQEQVGEGVSTMTINQDFNI